MRCFYNYSLIRCTSRLRLHCSSDKLNSFFLIAPCYTGNKK